MESQRLEYGKMQLASAEDLGIRCHFFQDWLKQIAWRAAKPKIPGLEDIEDITYVERCKAILDKTHDPSL